MNIKLTQFIIESSGSYITILNYISNGNISNSVNTLNSWSAAEQLLDEYTTSLAAGLAGAGATNVNVGSLENYTTYKKKDIIFDIQVSDIIDYTNILTNINTNLSNLNTNITNKNNQSDIVDCLKLIFVNRISGIESSVMKVNTDNDSVKTNSSIPVLLFKLAQLISSDSNYSYTSSNSLVNRALDNISKKLSLSGSDYIADQSTILGAINLLRNSFISDTSVTAGSVRNNSYLKNISDKLANANDLHTISQAIDLISTAIAQTNNTLTTTNSCLGNIATNINSIQSNPLIEVNIDVPYEVKNLSKKDTEY